MKMEQMENKVGGNGRSGRRRDAAFTFKDLLAVVAVLGLLGMVAIPVLANSKSGSKRAVCANNLSHIGRAFALWGNDHGDKIPTHVLERDGGTKNHPSGLQNNLWFHFAFLSNELVTPKVLACPSDRLVKVAGDFTRTSTNSFLRPQYQNQAVSYTLGHPYSEFGRRILSTDRNMFLDGGVNVGCPFYGTVSGATDSASLCRWREFIHGKAGHLLFTDGSVELTDDTRLVTELSAYPPESNPGHFLFPRFTGSLEEEQ